MPVYIADSNPAVQGPADTFLSATDAIAHIFATHGEYLNLPDGNTGLIQVLMRNSSGIDFTDSPIISQFSLSGAEEIHLVGQFANGNPCRFAHADTSGGTLMRTFNSGAEMYGAEEDALILMGNPNQTTSATLWSPSDGSSLTKNVVFNGGTTNHYGGVASGNANGSLSDCKFTNCNLNGHGVARSSGISMDHCAFTSNAVIRSAGPITNSTFIDMASYSDGDGFLAGSDYNAFDVAKSVVKYAAGVTPANEDVSSIFSLDVATNLVADSNGGFDVTASSVLINADSSGAGIIGASSQILASDPPSAADGQMTLDFNTSLTIDLSTLVTDDLSSIDWGSLIIIQPTANGTLTVAGSVVTLDYTGSGFNGNNSFKYRVSDTDMIASNVGTVAVTVHALPSSSSLVEAGITFGQPFSLAMVAYTAGDSVAYVRVFLKDVGVDGAEYECTVTSNSDTLIECIAPPESTTPAMVNAEIVIKPILSL